MYGFFAAAGTGDASVKAASVVTKKIVTCMLNRGGGSMLKRRTLFDRRLRLRLSPTDIELKWLSLLD